VHVVFNADEPGAGDDIMESAVSTNGSAMTNELVAFTFPLRLSGLSAVEQQP
jgi:hypothetical protein